MKKVPEFDDYSAAFLFRRFLDSNSKRPRRKSLVQRVKGKGYHALISRQYRSQGSKDVYVRNVGSCARSLLSQNNLRKEPHMMRCEDMSDSKRNLPAVELTPAPIKGNGPAWEGKPLSGRRVEDCAAGRCQESAEVSGKCANNTSTLCLNAFQNTGGNGGIITLSGPTGTRCLTAVDASTAAAQSAEEGTATPCGGSEHTDDHDVEQNINLNLATPDDNLGQGSLDGFQELLQAAMQQSDAERAQDRESARNFRRVRQPSSLEQQHGPANQPIVSTPAEIQPPITTRSSASDHGEAECISAGSVHIANNATNESTDSRSLSSAVVPTLEFDLVAPVVVGRRWVRYLSPEGYAYLYDEVTGESEWAVSGEEAAQSPQTEEPTRDTTSGAMQGEMVDTGHVFGEQDGHKDLLGIDCTRTQERNTTVYPAKDESVGTCEVSQWSRDISGPDAR